MLFDGNTSPSQYITHFEVMTGQLQPNDALLTRVFVGCLAGAVYDWYRSLPDDCITSFAGFKQIFLERFYEGVNDMTMSALIKIKKRHNESTESFIERFC